MPACSGTSARPCLLRLEPSRLLGCWWILIHTLPGLAVIMTNPGPGLLALSIGCLVLHFRLRYPVSPGLLIAGLGARFALPAEARFGLRLTAASRLGSFWAELEFDDRPGSRFLILKDQLPEPGWRRLCLILRERV